MTLRREALVFPLALALLLAHAVFYRQDAAPPLWDEALHLLLSLRFHDFLAHPSRDSLADLRAAWDFYPPLYHACVGALFRLLGPTEAAARAVNLALLFVLGWGTHRAAAALFGRGAGALAAAFVVTFPVVTRMARMSMTDLGLAAFTAAAVGFLLESDLRTRRSAAWAGALLAAGLMTKWIFPAFVIGPLAVWTWSRARGPAAVAWWRGRLALAAAVAALLAAPWYAANVGTILARGRFLAGLGPVQHNPYGWNWANATVYARVVMHGFLAAPQKLVLLGAAAAALAVLAGLWRPEGPVGTARFGTRGALVLLASWLIVPYVAMTAISNKDPRFVLPLVAPLAVLSAWGLLAIPHRTLRRSAIAVVCAYLGALYLAAVVPPLRVPALRHDLASLAPPPDPGWPSAQIVEAIRRRLTAVSPHASIEIVPDFATVNPNTLTWLARRAGFRLDAHHPTDPREVDAEFWEYVLLKPEGDQGATHTTQASAAITARVLEQAGAFVPIEEVAGPLRLWRTRASRPPSDLRAGVIELSSPAARWHLGRGWGLAEAAGRWALERAAVARVQLEPARAHVLEVDLSPFPRLARPQVVTVRFHGEELARWTLPSAGGVFEATVPARLPTGGIDEIELAFSEHARPSELGLSADSRPLAAFVRQVRIVPR